MYNDEKNLYHYTYRKDGSEPSGYSRPGMDDPVQNYQTVSWQPVQEPPKKKKRLGLKIAALALSCALLGGAVGGGIVWGIGRTHRGSTTINVSGRPATTVALNTVDGKKEMRDSEVYAATVNSVVSINVTGSSGINNFGQKVPTASAGSGFVLTKDGYIVTNYHVVENADTVKVSMYNGDTYDATVVGGDSDYDIAIIKVDAQDLATVTLGNSDTLNVGDRVLAIGNPLGELTFSMSGGMVSCVNRAINVSGIPFNMIQTDASINPGNSGGPLLNQYGEVVGIVSAKYSSYSAETVEGLGFAIPINDVSAMIQDIMTNGYVTNKPYLGITGGTMNAQMAAQYRYDVEEGVFVYSVEENGAAAKAGLQMGDVIMKVGDTNITSMTDLTVVKKQYSAGDSVDFTVYRSGGNLTVNVTWDSVPKEQQNLSQQEQNNTQSENGYYEGTIDPWDMFNYFFGNSGHWGN